MPQPTFSSPWDKPVDPAYESFETGWKKWVADGGMFRYPATRWHPAKAQWYVYPAPRWEMIDRGIPALKAPTSMFGFTLPQTFKAVRDVARANAGYSHLVWNPYTGEWREARDTAAVPSKPPVPPGPGPSPSVDAAKRRALADRERDINAAYDEYARGAIDVVTLNRRIAEIDRRYAPLLG